MREREWFVIDRTVPERILPVDILKAGTEEHIRAAVIEALRNQGFLNYEGVDLLNFKVTDNFYLTAEGVAFSWNPIEIASYSEGFVSVLLPYAKIEHLLNPRGLELAKDVRKK
jgi:hypothetical protein